MIFLRAPLMQGRVEPEDDFADLGAEPVGFDDLGGVEVAPENPPTVNASDANALDRPTQVYGEGSRPEGMVETGRAPRRTLVLSEQTGLEAPGTPMRAAMVEDREVRPMTGLERFVDDTSRAQGAYMPDVANAFGLEMPSGQTVANATRQLAPNESQSLSDRISALVPTARMAPGTESQSDARTQAGVLGLGSGNPIVGPWIDELQGVNDVAHGGDYTEGRDRAREQMERANRQAPGATLAGSAPNILGMMLAGGPTASTTLGRIGQAAAVGTGLGANQGAGSAPELADIPREALTQGAIGGATAGVMQGVGEGISRVPGLLSRLFTRGGEGADQMAAADLLRARGLPTNAQPNTPFGRQVQRMGGEQGLAAALDAEGVGGRFPTPGGSAAAADDLMARGGADLETVHRLMAENGQPINTRPVIDELSALRNELANTRTGPDRASAGRIDRQLLAPLLDAPEAGADGMLTPANIDFAEAHRLRQGFDRIANYRNANPAQGSVMSAARDARGTLSGLMENAAEELSPAVREAWTGGNQRYALGALLRDYARAQGSQLPGAVAEGAAETVGGGLAGRATRGIVSNYGPAIRGRGLERLAPILRAMGGAAGRFAPILEQALQRGPAALAGTHFILSQTNPEYRQAIEAAEEQQGQAQ